MAYTSLWQQFSNRRIGVILLLGFASGLPLALTGKTLQGWMTVENVDLTTIGIFTLVSFPYTWKFLWAPFLDRYVPPLLGRRRGWMLITQLGLIASICAMGLTSPANATVMMAVLAVCVVTLSATQDIAIDAYRTDILHSSERGMGAALFVGAYRLAMLTSGALVFVIAPWIGWGTSYLLMAALMSIGVIGALFGPEATNGEHQPRSLADAVMHPFTDFMTRPMAVWFLVLIVLYKIGDAFAGTLSTTFLIRVLELDVQFIGIVDKGMGLAVSILGGIYGGVLMFRLGLYRSLMLFGILQAVTNIGYWVLAISDQSLTLTAIVIALENIAGGMGTAAFVALLMALCNVKYSATQFALLSALSALGRVYLGPMAGYLLDQEILDWPGFFILTTIAALPGLLLLSLMKRQIEFLDHGYE
jgi:MFS transporter, PAT family, beta-lactamase induction signal transducer AmpG